MLDRISQIESNVRGYVRLFPTVFDVARGSELWDVDGRRFVDFFCGAGTLNYGHNNPRAKAALLEYIQRDGIQHGLDTATQAKVDFLESFQEIVLRPRSFDYRIQFTGPTGTNAVEAAVKLARRKTERSHVVAFTHAYHGHSLGALALTANSYFHSEFYGSHDNVSHLPYDGYAEGVDSARLLKQMLADRSSGLPMPAAIILETVQGEGGVNVASDAWLQDVSEICRQYGILLIVDDIQVGNGRTGQFFSFERAGIQPDMVCLSKSLGGGLPFSLVLFKPEHDVWQPGQHTGTFRGNNLAFVVATALLDHWRNPQFEGHIEELRKISESRLDSIVAQHSQLGFRRRGRGLIQGLDVRDGNLARQVIDLSFRSGLLIEASGADDEVLKILPALTSSREILCEGLEILDQAVLAAVSGVGLPVATSMPTVCLENSGLASCTVNGHSGALG